MAKGFTPGMVVAEEVAERVHARLHKQLDEAIAKYNIGDENNTKPIEVFEQNPQLVGYGLALMAELESVNGLILKGLAEGHDPMKMHTRVELTKMMACLLFLEIFLADMQPEGK